MKRLSVLTCCMICIVLMGCKKSKDAANAEKAAAAGVPDTKHYERLIAGQDEDGHRAAEAKDWLDPKNTSNALWKISRRQTLEWVDALYQAGAAKVYAVYIPKDETVRINMCAELLVELPTDAEARKKVMKAFNRIDKAIWGEDHEAVKDEGQKFLELNMDS